MSKYVYILIALVFIVLAVRGLDVANFDFGSILPQENEETSHYDQQVGSDEIYISDLPPEARDTLRLIEQGGPFPYSKDGAVFYNREGHLPQKPKGYYHEYTVKTPGADDRGARRIVAGDGGEFYYTEDHYRTFKFVKE
jgi:ribonuclease T1